jgi:hypothetical protein
MASVLEVGGDQFLDRRLVLDDEDVGGHMAILGRTHDSFVTFSSSMM